MTTLAEVVSNDDLRLSVQLEIDPGTGFASFDMSGKTCKAMLVSQDHLTAYTSAITQSEAADGADWANSLVALEMTAAEVGDIGDFQGSGKIEVQVEFPEKKTFYADCQFVKGNIA